ncbi:hypothetical protein Lacal_1373 [Lacinutrix sp. 5H-3-7-4]|nr:hypothetical protein Lacal_1373 [Lacinutrix sp. 5H-3-7-4]
MSRFMKQLMFVLVFIIVSCASQKDEVYVEKISKEFINNEFKYDIDNKVYLVNKKFLYSYSLIHNDKLVDLDLKAIRLTIQGTTLPFSKFDPDYNQTVIKYEYLDEKGKLMFSERTGLIENNNNIWIHPPRQGDAGILQLSAFPYIKLNNKKNGYGN